MMHAKMTEVSSALNDKLTALLDQIQPSIPVGPTPQHSIHATLAWGDCAKDPTA